MEIRSTNHRTGRHWRHLRHSADTGEPTLSDRRTQESSRVGIKMEIPLNNLHVKFHPGILDSVLFCVSDLRRHHPSSIHPDPSQLHRRPFLCCTARLPRRNKRGQQPSTLHRSSSPIATGNLPVLGRRRGKTESDSKALAPPLLPPQTLLLCRVCNAGHFL